MRKEIDIRRKKDAVDTVDAADARANPLVRDAMLEDGRDTDGFPIDMMPMHGMFSFRYSSTEVFSQDGNMHVRMKQTHYKDGRLRTEECEGMLDHQAYERMVSQAQGYFLNQAFGFARLLLAPFLTRPGRKD